MPFNQNDCWCSVTHGGIDRDDYSCDEPCLIESFDNILDKIRAEIEDTGTYEQEVNGKTEFLKGINYCLEIIDKYKAESEDKE